MKPSCIISSVLIFASLLAFTRVQSQVEKLPLKNYAGILGGVEWNTISGGWGFEFERMFLSKDKFQFGVRAKHIFRYKYENLQLFSGQTSTSVSHNHVAATGYYFTAKENQYKGFFITSGLGISLSHIKNTSSQETPKLTSFSGAFDLGIGFQFNLGNKTAFRWANTLSYGPFVGAFTDTKISIGF